MFCASVSAILFCLTSCGRSVWCGTVETPTLYALVCCLHVYVLICVYKLRHRHLNTACLATAALSNTLEVCACVFVCVCVHEWVSCAEFPPRGPRRDCGCRKQEAQLVCVTTDESDSRVDHQHKPHEPFSDQFCNFTGSLWPNRDFQPRHLRFRINSSAVSCPDLIAGYVMWKRGNLFSFRGIWLGFIYTAQVALKQELNALPLCDDEQ